jgi:Flp pilus assembly protein TadG
MLKRKRSAHCGQVIVLTALVVATVLGGLLVAVADLLVLSSESTRADTAAYLGAQSGAESVDTTQFTSGVSSSGQLRLGSAAVGNCQRAVAVADPGAMATCVVSGSTITVTVTKKVQLPVPFAGVSSTVGAIRHAGAALGTVQPY